MTQIVGIGASPSASTAALIARLCFVRAAGSMPWRSFESAPAQNARPVPRMSSTRARLGDRVGDGSSSASTMSTPSAFRRSGRFSRIWTIPLRRCLDEQLGL